MTNEAAMLRPKYKRFLLKKNFDVQVGMGLGYAEYLPPSLHVKDYGDIAPGYFITVSAAGKAVFSLICLSKERDRETENHSNTVRCV